MSASKREEIVGTAWEYGAQTCMVFSNNWWLGNQLLPVQELSTPLDMILINNILQERLVRKEWQLSQDERRISNYS